MFLDVQRPMARCIQSSRAMYAGSQSVSSARNGPVLRLPRLFYDPRSLETDSSQRACLHAKCVLIDHEQAFVSSANFTEAAQQRNIEVGVLIRSRSFTTRLVEHFEALASAGLLKPVPGT